MLVASLERELGIGYSVRYPRMPGEDDPDYAAWKAALLDEFQSLEDGAILVGHSVGGTTVIRVLAEKQPRRKFGGLFVVAPPFLGEGGWPGDRNGTCDNVGGRLPSGLAVYLYHGGDDDIVPAAHVSLYAKAIPQAVIRAFEHGDHQLGNDMSAVARDIHALG